MIRVQKTIQRRVMTERGELLHVAIAPEGIYFRKPRARQPNLLPWGHAALRAGAIAAEAMRQEKVAPRVKKAVKKAVAK